MNRGSEPPDRVAGVTDAIAVAVGAATPLGRSTLDPPTRTLRM